MVVVAVAVAAVAVAAVAVAVAAATAVQVGMEVEVGVTTYYLTSDYSQRHEERHRLLVGVRRELAAGSVDVHGRLAR